MSVNFLIRGLLIGLSVAAAVGPMSILCIQRTLHKGLLYGLISGLGIATADACYGCVAGFGLTVIATFLVHQQIWIRLIGGLFLLYLGLRTLLTPPAEKAAIATTTTNFIGAYLSTFLLTLTNPLTILSFVAIFAGLGVGGANTLAALLVVAGVFLGSSLWWGVLTAAISLLQARFTPLWLLWINRISGLIITLFGLLALITVLHF